MSDAPSGRGGGPGLRQADYQALAAFRHALRGFSAFSEAAAHAAGLTPQQHQVLLAIKGAPDGAALTVGMVAEALLIRPHTAAELVNRLEGMGLVRRSADPGDRRRVRVSLTEAAEYALHELTTAHVRELRAIRPALLRLIEQFGER
jgi:DNA-binding MarR family transcriptional regulator